MTDHHHDHDHKHLDADATFAGKTKLSVEIEAATHGEESELTITFKDDDRTGAWDILAFGGADDVPHRLANMKSIAMHFESSTDLAAVSAALKFAAEALADLAAPAPRAH